MKNISKLILAAASLIGFFAACSKVDNLTKEDALPIYALGISPVLSSSSTGTIPLTIADTSKTVVTFFWTNPKYANDSTSSKYILEIDSAGRNFAKENTIITTGALNKALTGRELNAILLNLGLKLNVAQSIDVRLISSYGNNNERYMSNPLKLTVTPIADPSVLISANSSVTCSLANFSLPSNTFSWAASFKGYSDSVYYTIQYDSAGKNFVVPIDFAVGTPLSKTLTQGEMNTSALNSGITAGASGKVEYRIKAVTASGAIAYSNVVNVTIQSYIPILRMYMPGGYQAATGNGNDWDPATAPELIRDQRTGVNNDMYYIYIFLPANAEFKITQGRAWDIAFGTGSTAGSVTSNNGGNFKVTTAGFYRVTINRTTLKYDIRVGRMGFVGSATGADWTPPNVFPNYALGNSGTNLFVGITTFNNGGWKLIDGDTWDNGSKSVDEARNYGTKGPDGSTLEINANSFTDITNGPKRNRVIWDGRDVNNTKYFTSPAVEMRVVGDGMNQAGVGDWSPGTSPQMTYGGNGVWTLTIALKAGKDIKFLAGNDWGAFDYEDNSGGSTAVGTPRKIKWEGGDNFKTPTVAGTYTITLNENLQTVTIN